jgi:hypothetical protein
MFADCPCRVEEPHDRGEPRVVSAQLNGQIKRFSLLCRQLQCDSLRFAGACSEEEYARQRPSSRLPGYRERAGVVSKSEEQQP